MKNRTGNTPALAVHDLHIGYPDATPPLHLCAPLRFELGAGSLTAIVGVNGVGKSTLMRTLAGLQVAFAGEIEFLGKPLGQLSPNARARHLSVVLTDPPASRNLKVRELIALGRHPYTDWLGKLSAKDRESVDAAIQGMELMPLADRPCFTLSDGQMQRVLIARALAQETPVILLDEPTTHLDLYHKVQILKSLRDIAHKQAKTVVFTTHEIDLAIQLCSHMVVLREGGYTFGEPCELISKGAFDTLFPADTVIFDREQGSFKVQK